MFNSQPSLHRPQISFFPFTTSRHLEVEVARLAVPTSEQRVPAQSSEAVTAGRNSADTMTESEAASTGGVCVGVSAHFIRYVGGLVDVVLAVVLAVVSELWICW